MGEGASVTYHINEFNMIISQLSSVEITLNDEIKALILLSCWPKSWSVTVIVVSISLGNSKLKLNDIQDLILRWEHCT